MAGLNAVSSVNVNFKADSNQNNKQYKPLVIPQQVDRQALAIDQYQKEQKKEKRKNNIVLAVTLAGTTLMAVFFGRALIKDIKAEKRQKEAERMLEDMARDAAEELKKSGEVIVGSINEQVAKIKNPKIKQAAVKELSKPIGSASELKLKELIALDSIEEKSFKPIDLKKAAKTLDEDLVGEEMEEVKESILRAFVDYNERLAKGTLSKEPFVLMLHSGPGQGKTTIAKVIAKILDRPYGSISCAGRTGSSCIDGVEQQFVGADAGRIGQIHVQNHSKQNVILVDEIDKFGKSQEHGDPISAMLPMLDERAAIEDQFLGIPVDVSQDLFILTANDMSKLPEYFINRLEPIFIKPYGTKTKAGIAKMKLKTLLADRKITVKNIDDSIYDIIANAADDTGGRQTTKKVKALVEEIAIQEELGEVAEGTAEITEKLVRDLLDGKMPSITERINNSKTKVK